MSSAVNELVYHKELGKASGLLRACTHPLRMKLLTYIHSHKRINVNNIYRTMQLEQSITSQHLKILRDARVVTAVRDGKFIFYSLNYNRLALLESCMKKYFKD